MKKLFIVFVMLLAGSAWAEWVMFEKTETRTFYFDPASIRKEKNMRRVWQLTNYDQRDKSGGMSYRVRYEYNCDKDSPLRQAQFRFLGGSKHSELMAGGTVLLTQGPEFTWDEIAPGTIAETILDIVCAK
jgi:hypothetical protein